MPLRANRDLMKSLLSRGSIVSVERRRRGEGSGNEGPPFAGANGMSIAQGVLTSLAVAPAETGPTPYPYRLILALVDQAVLLDPGHHVAQLRAHNLDFVRLPDAPHRLQGRSAGAILENEFARELPGL